MKFKIIFFLSFLNLLNINIFCADWLITTSGTYMLNDDLLSTNADSNGAIHIQSSFVTLDLGGRFVYQNNSTASANGIVIDANLTDIIVKNGTIINFTRCGVTVNSGCIKIKLQDLIIESCAIRGMELNGSSTSMITQSEVNNCKILSCCSSNSTDNVMTMSQCENVNVSNCLLANNTGATVNKFIMLKVDSSLNCNISNLIIETNSCTSSGSNSYMHGVGIHVSSNCVFSRCIVRNQTSNVSVLGGFSVIFAASVVNSATCRNNLFVDCQVLDLGSTAASGGDVDYPYVVGFSTYDFSSGGTTGGALQTVYKRCLVSGLTAAGTTSYGRIDGFSCALDSIGTVYEDCTAVSFSGAGDLMAGFFIASSFGTMTRCEGSNHITSFSSCNVQGIRASGMTSWIVRDCNFNNNINSGTVGNGAGVSTGSGGLADTIFTKTFHMDKTTTASSAQTLTSLTMNSSTAPWANLLITS